MTHPSLAQAKLAARAGRDDEAIDLIQQAAMAGDGDALFMLAEMTWRGGLIEQDCGLGRKLYEQAAQAGHTGAGIYFTNLLASGIAGARDWPAAIARLELEGARNPARRTVLELVRAMELDADGDPHHRPQGERISDRPDAQVFHSLLTQDECVYLISVAQPGYQPSMVFNEAEQWVRDTIRTSDGSPIHWLIEDPVVHALNRRVAAASGTAYENGETLQSLRYRPGQEYRPHFDFVAGDNRRLWTGLIYLNDDYDGGETAFVQTELKVRGKGGDMLLFSNVTPDGEFDPMAEHAGLPVTRGAKYLATRWIREGRWIP